MTRTQDGPDDNHIDFLIFYPHSFVFPVCSQRSTTCEDRLQLISKATDGQKNDILSKVNFEREVNSIQLVWLPHISLGHCREITRAKRLAEAISETHISSTFHLVILCVTVFS